MLIWKPDLKKKKFRGRFQGEGQVRSRVVINFKVIWIDAMQIITESRISKKGFEVVRYFC
jgi:hypothetical protein